MHEMIAYFDITLMKRSYGMYQAEQEPGDIN
jgi:hypothetical protein